MASISDLNIFTRNLCDADTSNYTDANLLIATNQAYEEAVARIIQCDGRWQFDDTNFTSFPVGTATLVASQRDYQFDTSMLVVERVEILDVNGNYYRIQPIDNDDLQGVAISEFMETAGSPQYYDVQGSSIVLFPAPDAGVSVTLVAGLKVYYKRTADLFTSAQVTTGTKQPGFASPFHHILSYKAAVPYCIKFHPDRVQAYESKAARLEDAMVKHYSKRDKDERAIMTMVPIRHR